MKPALWINTNFTNKEEVRLMTELISLHSFFSQRTGSINSIANPCITINDQVKVYERTTSETYIHYIQSINTQMDLDTGEYTASITTNWLGDENEWVIAGSTDGNPHYLDRFVISERLDRWQLETGRGLDTGNAGTAPTGIVLFNGEFDTVTVTGTG